MSVITALIVGVIVGWLLEWAIDFFFWRRKNRELAGELDVTRSRLGEVEVSESHMRDRLATLETSAQQFDAERADLQARVYGLAADRAALETRVADLSARNEILAAQLASQAETRAQFVETEVPEISQEALTGNVDPTDAEEMAKFKYPLEYVEGIGPIYAEKLKAIGLVTCLDLLKAGASRKGRGEIAETSGIPGSLILEWVNHVDLYRIKGVGSEYADLLEAAGVDTVVELALRNPANLSVTMNEVNTEKKLVRKPPTQTQVKNWVAQAKDLPRVITF
jgi:predicted flap endonuclease-1-like 5' DNA nuclease